MKNLILGGALYACLLVVTPVAADGGMTAASAPTAEVAAGSTLVEQINQLVAMTLQLFTWTNSDGAIAFTDTNYSVQYDCNTIFGTYAVNRTAITLSTPASTLMACPEAAMDADQALIADLSNITALTFKDGQLVMTGGDSELTFAATLVAEEEAAEVATDYVGMTVAEAEAAAAANGVAFRIGTLDGEGMALTADFVIGRVTAEVANDIVVSFNVEAE